MVSGHMCCGIVDDTLMARVGPDNYESSLEEPHVSEMDFTGRAMKGMVYVGVDGLVSDDDLSAWVGRGADFAGSLSPK